VRIWGSLVDEPFPGNFDRNEESYIPVTGPIFPGTGPIFPGTGPIFPGTGSSTKEPCIPTNRALKFLDTTHDYSPAATIRRKSEATKFSVKESNI